MSISDVEREEMERMPPERRAAYEKIYHARSFMEGMFGPDRRLWTHTGATQLDELGELIIRVELRAAHLRREADRRPLHGCEEPPPAPLSFAESMAEIRDLERRVHGDR